jgi:hypothetical protein
MDLLDENRSLIHTGKLLRQPDNGFEWSGWTELFVLLFDNYRGWNYISMSAHKRNLKLVDSCYDETEREGWCHEVSYFQKGKVYGLPRE